MDHRSALKYLSQKLGYQARKHSINVASQLGFNKWLLSDRPGSCILLYHGIDVAGRTGINGRFISAKRFEQQLIFLKKNYQILTTAELFAGKGDSERMKVAIAFDDGYRNNIQLALPILEKHQIPATFFVTAINDTPYPMLWADYLDLATYLSSKKIDIAGEEYFKQQGIYKHSSGNSLKSICKNRDWSFKQKIYESFPEATTLLVAEQWKPYWETLSDQEIIQLAASPYAKVGLHAYYHDNLGLLPSQEAILLINKGKSYLENLLQENVDSYAYADGSYNHALIDYLEGIGIKEQYAVDYLYEENQKDPRIRNRLTINPYTSFPHQVYAILHGAY